MYISMKLLLPGKSIVYLLSTMMLFSHCRVDKVTPQTDSIAITDPGISPISGTIPLKNMFGVNGYEWNFLGSVASPNDRHINESNVALIKSFSAFRHYMNWNKLEYTEGYYTYNPTNDGSWNYDLIYTRCKQEGILVLADMKNCPNWMMATYPTSQQDDENAPVTYGSDLSKPASYAQMARTAFQFAARYGYNSAVNKTLVTVDTRPRWTNDQINVVQVGMGLIKYMECNNEPNRWWKGPQTTQTAEQYAANLSAFYDGDKGKLGANAGVKTADPSMTVVIGGLATIDPAYVKAMIDWCKTNRGYKADGSVNLCFDVINYHFYSNNANPVTLKGATVGVAPELSIAGTVANNFMALANQYNLPVWVTEAGYDINPGSYQRAIAIGNKSVLMTQADWLLRTALLYIRHGIQRVFYYQLFDDTANDPSQYSTSGLNEGYTRRPAADYILQATKLMGDYTYIKTINADPLVDQYQSGTKTMFILTIPDQKGRTSTYSLDLGTATSANVYTLQVGADTMSKTTVATTNGKLTVTATETPLFVEPVQ